MTHRALTSLAHNTASWIGLCRLLVVDPQNTSSIWAEVSAAYSDPCRHYHDHSHLASCLAALDRHLDLAKDHSRIRWALFFHDLVYDVKASDAKNVSLSARAASDAASSAGLGGIFAADVERLVSCTGHDDSRLTGDEALIADIDLIVLAGSSQEYAAYMNAVWREFRWAGRERFKRAREEVLKGILDRERIYQNAEMRERYESLARTNVAQELHFLRSE